MVYIHGCTNFFLGAFPQVTLELGLSVFERLYTEFNYKARWLPESDKQFTAEDLSYEANYTRFVELAKIDRLNNFWFFK